MRTPPGQTINIVQAQTIKGFVGVYPLGLHCFHGCEYGAVDEGHIIVSVDRIRTHTQTVYIYDNYYISMREYVSVFLRYHLLALSQNQSLGIALLPQNFELKSGRRFYFPCPRYIDIKAHAA